MKREHAYKLRDLMHKAARSLDDTDALDGVELFPEWSLTDYESGDRVRHGGILYKCLQAHTAQADWTPDAAASLWARVAEPGEIPVWVQPTGSHDAYNKGDKVYYPDKSGAVYESLIDANIWSPEAYPTGWKKNTSGN